MEPQAGALLGMGLCALGFFGAAIGVGGSAGAVVLPIARLVSRFPSLAVIFSSPSWTSRCSYVRDPSLSVSFRTRIACAYGGIPGAAIPEPGDWYFCVVGGQPSSRAEDLGRRAVACPDEVCPADPLLVAGDPRVLVAGHPRGIGLL